MKKHLDNKIGNLYKVFSKYKLKETIESCDCCHTEDEKSILISKPLSSIEESEISNYAFSALLTIGNENDFKYFLPRVFELLSKRELYIGTFVILQKLDIADWLNWSELEIKAIKDFLFAWWKFDINCSSFFDSENLVEINKKVNDLKTLLDIWKLENKGLENFVEFIEGDFLLMQKGKGNYKELSHQEIEIFTNWAESNYDKLENFYSTNVN